METRTHLKVRGIFLSGALIVCQFAFSPVRAIAQTLAAALDTTNLVWTTGGNSVWFPQTTNTHDGVDAVRHGNVASNETSWLETTIMGPATVRFWTFYVSGSWPSAYVGFSINGGGSQVLVCLVRPATLGVNPS